MNNYDNIEGRIDLVISEMKKKFPNRNYTVKILLWNDGDSLVECRHGDSEKIYNFVHHDGKLTVEETKMLSNRIFVDELGDEYYIGEKVRKEVKNEEN